MMENVLLGKLKIRKCLLDKIRTIVTFQYYNHVNALKTLQSNNHCSQNKEPHPWSWIQSGVTIYNDFLVYLLISNIQQ